MATPADPSWAAPAILTGFIAALGYVGKTVAELVLQRRETVRDRRSRLVELYALLRAGDAAYAAQRRLLKRLATSDRASLARAVQVVLQWDFDRVIVAHGAVVEHGGKEGLTTAYGAFLDGALESCAGNHSITQVHQP